MKNRLIFSTLVTIVSLMAVHAAPSEQVESTISKARAYLGSEQKLNGVNSIQYRGTVTLYQGKDAEGNDREPLVGRAILSFEKPAAQKIEFIFEKQSLVTGFDGYEGYEYVELKRDGADPIINIRSIGGDELRRNKAAAMENLYFFRPFKFDGNNVVDKGVSTVEGKQVHQIDFVHNGKFVFGRFFDLSNGDLVKTILDTGMVTYETGELMVDGVRFSKKTVGELNGETKYEMVFDEIVINPEFDVKMFEYPMF